MVKLGIVIDKRQKLNKGVLEEKELYLNQELKEIKREQNRWGEFIAFNNRSIQINFVDRTLLKFN